MPSGVNYFFANLLILPRLLFLYCQNQGNWGTGFGKKSLRRERCKDGFALGPWPALCESDLTNWPAQVFRLVQGFGPKAYNMHLFSLCVFVLVSFKNLRWK